MTEPVKERRAECACGQLVGICAGEPIRVSVCHCLACKRRTGSAFSNNARYAPQSVRITGQAKEYTRVGDEGSHVTYSFCPECGVTVFYRIDAQPDLIAIPVGAFAEVDFPPPQFSVYHGDRKAKWLEITADPLTIWD